MNRTVQLTYFKEGLIVIVFTSEQEKMYFAQRSLNESTGSKLVTDGVMGLNTQLALQVYQQKQGLQVTGELDEITWSFLGDLASIRFLTRQAVIASATAIGVDPSIAIAIREVTGKPEGFLADGRVVVRFEHHKFYQYVSSRLGGSTALQWAQKYPNLCSPFWSQTVYKDPEGEWERFDQARMLDATCAMLSSSWGMFQLMGFNYAMAEYDSVQDMVGEMNYSEIFQQSALMRFIQNQPLFLAALKNHEHERIARMFSDHASQTQDYLAKLRAVDTANERFN